MPRASIHNREEFPNVTNHPKKFTENEERDDRVSDDKQIRFDVSVDHGSFSPSHWHEAIEIIYVLEGSAVVTLFDFTITLKPGQMLLINSGLVHSSRCPSGNRTILMQIPDDLLLSFLPDVSHLWFVIDYDSPNRRYRRISRDCGICFWI